MKSVSRHQKKKKTSQLTEEWCMKNKSCHEESEYNCDEGKNQETNERNFEDHKKSAHGGIKYFCEKCNYDATEERAINNKHAQELS